LELKCVSGFFVSPSIESKKYRPRIHIQCHCGDFVRLFPHRQNSSFNKPNGLVEGLIANHIGTEIPLTVLEAAQTAALDDIATKPVNNNVLISVRIRNTRRGIVVSLNGTRFKYLSRSALFQANKTVPERKTNVTTARIQVQIDWRNGPLKGTPFLSSNSGASATDSGHDSLSPSTGAKGLNSADPGCAWEANGEG